MPTPLRGDRDAADGVHLFVYGTLADEFVYQVITGEHPRTTAAVLEGYRKVASLKSYPYVVPQASSKVEGVLVSGVSPKALAQVDRYEGEGILYLRQKVTLKTADGPKDGYVYAAGPELLAARPSPEVEVADRVADFLKDRIEVAIAADVPAESGLRELEVRAREELLGEAVEDLVREYFDHPGLPAFAVKHRLEESGLPSLKWLRKEAAAVKHAPQYVRLIVKTIIFNQIEERVRRDFRGAVRVAEKYYEHAISALAALQYVADNLGPIGEIMEALGVADYDDRRRTLRPRPPRAVRREDKGAPGGGRRAAGVRGRVQPLGRRHHRRRPGGRRRLRRVLLLRRLRPRPPPVEARRPRRQPPRRNAVPRPGARLPGVRGRPLQDPGRPLQTGHRGPVHTLGLRHRRGHVRRN